MNHLAHAFLSLCFVRMESMSMFQCNIALWFLATMLFFHKSMLGDDGSCVDVHTLGFSVKRVCRTHGTNYPLFVQTLAVVRQRGCHTNYCQKLVYLYLTLLLLAQSYAPEPNPGPSTDVLDHPSLDWLRGICDATVSWEDRGVACEACGLWYHAHCENIHSETYANLTPNVQWFCNFCGQQNNLLVFDLYSSASSLDWSLSTLRDPSRTGSCRSPVEVNFRPQHASTPTIATQQDGRLNKPLRILNINFQSVTGKKAEFGYLLDSSKPGIVIGTETHLTEENKISEFLPNRHGYKEYRRDRNRDGGGVMILIKDCYNSTRVEELETNCEVVWTKLSLKRRRSLYICSYYRPDVSHKASLQEFEISVQRVASISNAMLLIGGDLNFPGWDWSTMTLKPQTKYVEMHHQLVQISDDNGLEQMVTVPTIGENTLDLIMWCSCGECEAMGTISECRCCSEIPEMTRLLNEASAQCITRHPDFKSVCLDRYVLQTCYTWYNQQYRRTIQEGNNRYRYVSYWMLARLAWGRLGKDIRVTLSAGAVMHIRKACPSPDGVDTGYLEAGS